MSHLGSISMGGLPYFSISYTGYGVIGQCTLELNLVGVPLWCS